MKLLGLLSLLVVPLFACAHGLNGEVTAAPLPVSYAVQAGFIALIGSFVYALRSGAYSKEPLVLSPQSKKVLVSTAVSFFAVCALLYDALPILFWFGLLSCGAVIASMVRIRGDIVTNMSLAPLLLLALFLFEFLSKRADSSEDLLVMLSVYTVVMFITRIFAPKLFESHELFTQLMRLYGRYAPYGTTRGFYEASGALSEVLIVAVLITGTSFDGLMHSVYWKAVVDFFGITELSGLHITLLFIGSVCGFVLLYAVTIALMYDDVREKVSTSYRHLFTLFAAPCAPIAVGYALAHNATRVVPLWGDFSFAYLWIFQVLAIIGGHIYATLCAHRVALLTFKNSAVAQRSQYALIVFMVIVTTISIFLLQAPQ